LRHRAFLFRAVEFGLAGEGDAEREERSDATKDLSDRRESGPPKAREFQLHGL